MRFPLSTLAVGLLPFALAYLCYRGGFEVNTNQTLTLFLPLVWGILFALGGGVVYLNDHRFDVATPAGKILDAIAERTRVFSLVLIGHLMIFILLAIMFPARAFLSNVFGLSGTGLSIARSSAESLLFCTIAVPALFSVVVGACCLLVSFNRDKQVRK